ncbi:hypothetical protein M23134_03734 [Microscilla marina ATCC 23134]|uniref:Uncharacterized protein n=1 Tax=Microscilla marina ATCC 23134 TaxID=313606 RepID=A1ZPC7_MICM2|nr:hypothetical protein M23134_03734 [Microscilla marina ATCC 23134]
MYISATNKGNLLGIFNSTSVLNKNILVLWELSSLYIISSLFWWLSNLQKTSIA